MMLVSLMLLREMELAVPVAVQSIPLSLFALVFPFPFTFSAVFLSFFPLPLTSRPFGGWDPSTNRNDSRS